MKKATLFIVFLNIALSLSADPTSNPYRGLIQFGAALTLGRDSGLASPGYGLSISNFTYFDPSSKNGFYFGVLSDSFLFHVAGKSVIADTKPVLLGYRQTLGATDLALGINAAPVIGARYDGNLLLGSAYTGIGGALTFYVGVLPFMDLGISVEPVLNLARWGAPQAKDLTYCDIVLYTVFKNNLVIAQNPW